ncbi:MAG TPA: site-2 protease family protein, partial [Aggregatilineales bacterium]|nr:site-2 protease family protein [Aggregatilineales bacterium]
LNIFGGQAQITREPERPEHEFWIALAGPLSSLFLAVFFQVAAWLPGIAGVACGWLSAVNMTLAIFNLLPGFPLDGGRVLRALLWWRWGSYRRATTAASRAGQWVAGGIMLFGFAIFVQGGVISAVLIAMTGFYLYTLSLLSYRTVGGGMPLTKPADLSVQRVMRSHIPIIDPDMRLAIFAWRYLDHAHDQAFPVMVGDALQGMITLAQIEHLPRLEWGKHRVGEYMIPREQLILVGVEDDLETTLKALDTGKVNHAPVYAGEQFVGMLNRRDIIYRT